ncbi:aminotransferase class III-fold pyridoxal phosphate-dependent enzyme [Candidatus Sulfurimonas marisnigri]|uniref:Aminotransferase class III-fold pyridoxal phosphate-dependent enzyme n=1 Tax=Candidatus Sulfurimonas marisnigri TaxID=2740405 RepID=A0A7S7LZY6_9BACT|nr:aminotransferase class III-fold pyridoxal phosphate-dependent enzyme [Candidatus Sulfurimonas marisnigri]QOY54557.1 aminotransferase class III-fold pyridoxal phosphate-dependent enzyme [Candidatus Sulfurimonas marisnigri]
MQNYGLNIMKNKSLVLNEGYAPDDNKLYIKESYDCYIKDVKNNIYIDTAMGGGSFVLGHAQKFIQNEIIKQLKKGSLYTLPNEKTHELASLLNQAIPNFNRFVFCSTGSEATMRAIRIARAYTNKKKIAIFSGSWHGSHDLLMVDDTYVGNEQVPKKILKSNGMLHDILKNIILLPYNQEKAFEIITKNKNDLAMVLIEPAQGSNPRDDIKGFLQNLRKTTQEHDILLGFDEIITGFRVALGGAQEYYGIKADIATYGKAVGGGLPLAVVAGTQKVMQTIKVGTKENPQSIFMGGTFSANPLSITASYTMLKHLIKNKNKIYPKLEKKSKYFRDSINKICQINEVSAHMIGINSMLRFIFTSFPVTSRHSRDQHEKSIEIQSLFYKNMLENHKIHIASNRINFLSIKHKKKDIDKIIKAYEIEIKRFKEMGYL